MRLICIILLITSYYSCKQAPTNTTTIDTKAVSEQNVEFKTIQECKEPITIDGKAIESSWSDALWYNIDQVWLGEALTKEDFSGRYKVLWDENHIYVLAEIQDDTLIDIHDDGLDRYWDDDCLEIFVDENRSKGNHQYNHNAFAYHISLEGVVADIGSDSLPQYYDHVLSKRITTGTKTIWEVAMKIYPDTYLDGVVSEPSKLLKDKHLGFAIAYCDNDHSAERENFIGSVAVEGEDKNRGWIDAGIFEEIVLKSKK